MFNIGPAELLVVLVIALLVLGPNKLPDAARQVGRAIGEMRKLSSGFQAEMRDALKEPVEGKPAATSRSSAKSVPAETGGSLSAPRLPAGDAPAPASAVEATDGPTTGDGAATPLPAPNVAAVQTDHTSAVESTAEVEPALQPDRPGTTAS